MTAVSSRPHPSLQRLRTRRKSLLFSCALGTCLAFAAHADPARAQAINATPTTASGSVTYSRNISPIPGSETITINSPTAIINWQPPAVTPNPYIFLPAGNTVTFENGNVADFAVLNRIFSNVPAEFDGTVISRLTDASTGLSRPGGTVIFSSPGGIIVGPTGVFDVGNLVLTTLNVVTDANGNFINPNGGFQYEFDNGAANPNAAVVTRAGSQIIANSENSYFAMVAPVVQHGGSARVNGSVAYIAGEEVQFNVAQGLFDIVVPVGSDNAQPIVHTGTTAGPASTGGSDNHVIYMVAVPKNQAITMLLEGNVGYDAASSAAIENGVILLSSGFDVSGTSVDDTTAQQGADIEINGGAFSSDTFAHAVNDVVAGTQNSSLDFTQDVQLSGGDSAQLVANQGRTVTVGGNARILSPGAYSPDVDPGGFASMRADTGGSITITGNAEVDASQSDEFDQTGAPGDGVAGTAQVIANSGDITIGGSLGVFAIGEGSSSRLSGTDGSDGFGGTILVSASDGNLSAGGAFTADARGIGGAGTDGVDQALFPQDGGAGGDGRGGTINIDAGAGGTITLNEAVVSADGEGAAGGAGSSLQEAGNGGAGGAGTGGFIEARSTGGTLNLTSDGSSNLFARGFGGAGGAGGDANQLDGGAGGAGGAATGGQARLISTSGTVDADDVNLEGAASGGDGGAGGAGGGLSVGIGVGGAGGAGGNAASGEARLDAAGGAIATGEAIVNVNADGGAGGDGGTGSADGNGGAGGNGVAGIDQANFTRGAYVVTEGGDLTVGQVFIESIGIGGQGGQGAIGGDGGDGTGGGAQFVSLGGTLRATGLVNVDSRGFGGAGGAGLGGGVSGGVGGNGGDGFGGFALLSAESDSSAVVDASDGGLFAGGFGGDGGAGGGADSSGGTGGDGGDGGVGDGGTAEIFSQAGAISTGNFAVAASGAGGAGGAGGDAPSPGGTGGDGGTGGVGRGGFAGVLGSVNTIGSTLALGDVNIEASGDTGAAGPGGAGAGANGTAGGTSATEGGLVQVTSNQNVTTGATTSLTAGDVSITATGDSATQIVVSARRAPATFDSLTVFGRGVLRNATFASGATLRVNGDASVDVDSDLFFYTFGTGLIDVGGATRLDTPQSIITDELPTGEATASNINTGSFAGNAGVDFRGSTTTLTAADFISILTETGGITLDIGNAGGDIGLNAVTDVTVGTLDSGGSIDITALGAVDAGTLTAVGNVTVDPDTVVIDSVTAGGDITLEADSFITVDFAQAGDDFTATSGGGFTGGTVATTGLGTDSEGGSGALAGSDIVVDAESDLRLDNADAADSIQLTTGGTGNVLSTGLLRAGGDLFVFGFDIDVNDAESGGNIDLGAVRNITIDSGISGGNITANAFILLDEGQIDARSLVSDGVIALTATVAVNVQSADAGVDLLVESGQTVDILSATAGRNIEIFNGGPLTPSGASDLSVNLLSAAAGGDVTITGEGDVIVGSAQAGDDFTADAGGLFTGATVTTTGLGVDSEDGSGELAGSNIDVDSAADLRLDTGTAPDTIDLDSANNSIFSAGTLTANLLLADAAGDLALNDVVVTSALNLNAPGGSIGGNSFTSEGDINLSSADGITLAAAASGGSIKVTTPAAVDLGTIVAAGNISVDPTLVDIDSATAGGDIELTATSDITIGFAQAGDDFTADAGGAFTGETVTTTGLGADSEGGSGALAGSNIDVDAVGDLRLDNGTAADSLRLTSTTGNILSGVAGSDSPGTLTAGDDLLADAAGDILIGDAQAGTDITLDAGRDVVARDLGAVGTIDVTAGNDITFRNMVTQVGDVILRPGGDLTGTGLLDVAGSLDIAMDGDIDFNEVEAGANILLTSNLGSISIGSADAGGFIAITTSNSDPALAGFTAGTLVAGGDIETDIAGATQIDSATSGGEIDLSSEGNLVAGTLRSDQSTVLESRAGNVSVTSVTANLANDPSDTAIQGFAASAIAGNVAVGSANADNIALGATGTVSAGNLVSRNLLLIFAGDDVSLGSVDAGGRFYISDPATAIALDVFGDEDITVDELVAALNAIPQGRSGGDITISGPVQAGSMSLRGSGDGIFLADMTSGPVLIDLLGNAAFGGLVAAPTIEIVSSDIDIGASGGLGDDATGLVSLTVLASDQQTVLGGSTEGDGYTLADAEADRISAATLRVLAPQNGTGANRPADVVVRDLSLDGGRIGTFELLTGGIARVEGALILSGADPDNVIDIRADERVEVVTPSGSIRIRDAAGLPAGTLNLTSGNIWAASSALLDQLRADPNFAGRDDALRRNDGPEEPRGYIEAADVSLFVGDTLFVQNSGSPFAFAGITVTQDTLTITPTGTEPISVFAFGRRINSDGSFVTNAQFFREVAFSQGDGGIGYTDESQFNLCVINTGACRGTIETPLPGGSEIIEDPVEGSDEVGLAPTITNELVDSSFSQEPLIEEPVTSGADSILWDCDRDDDGDCDEDDTHD